MYSSCGNVWSEQRTECVRMVFIDKCSLEKQEIRLYGETEHIKALCGYDTL